MADTNHRTWLSVDVVALIVGDPLRLALIRREPSPYSGELTLPGGLLDAAAGETVTQAAVRILRAKAGVDLHDGPPPAVVDVVSEPGRDERGHTVSIVVATSIAEPGASTVAVPVTAIPDDMPFGHSTIARRALDVIRQRILVDAATSYAVAGARVTWPDVESLLGGLDAATGHPITTAEAARKRLHRSDVYRPGDETVPTKGRPLRVYEPTGSP